MGRSPVVLESYILSCASFLGGCLVIVDPVELLAVSLKNECGSYVVEQLRCLGVLRTCEVLKVGMPTRVSYGDLKQVRTNKLSSIFVVLLIAAVAVQKEL